MVTDLSHTETVNRFVRHATLRQLQLLEAIVRLGSFTRAAEEMFLTQPTVSMQIKKLTDTVGMPLFLHVGRTVEPTDAGREVYAACRTILRTLSDLESKLADLKGLRSGRLRLGVITTAKYFAPEILGAFCEQFPGIDVTLKVTNRARIIERIAAGDDDLYIFGEPAGTSIEVEATPLAPNPLVVLARTDHPLVGQAGISLERLAEERLILREPGSGTRDAVVRRLTDRGLQPRVRMELGSNEAIKHAIIAGLGISALSLHTLTLDAAAGRPPLVGWHCWTSRASRSSAGGIWCTPRAVSSRPSPRPSWPSPSTVRARSGARSRGHSHSCSSPTYRADRSSAPSWSSSSSPRRSRSRIRRNGTARVIRRASRAMPSRCRHA